MGCNNSYLFLGFHFYFAKGGELALITVLWCFTTLWVIVSTPHQTFYNAKVSWRMNT